MDFFSLRKKREKQMTEFTGCEEMCLFVLMIGEILARS